MSVFDRKTRAGLRSALVEHSKDRGHVFAVYTVSHPRCYNNVLYLVPRMSHAIDLAYKLSADIQKKSPFMTHSAEVIEDGLLQSIHLLHKDDDTLATDVRLCRIEHYYDPDKDLHYIPQRIVVTHPWGNVTVLDDQLSLDLFIAHEALETRTFNEYMRLSGDDLKDVNFAMEMSKEMNDRRIDRFFMRISDVGYSVYSTRCDSVVRYPEELDVSCYFYDDNIT